MFSEKAKEERDLHQRRNSLARRLQFERDADKRRELFDELEKYHTRLAELDAKPDTHRCFCCLASYSAASANVKIQVTKIVICEKTGRPVEEKSYPPGRMVGVCEACITDRLAYLEE